MTLKNTPLLLTTLIGIILMHSFIASADDTPTKTCANGAGTVIIGAITGHEYCLSKKEMNWWNGHAWCDGLGMRFFRLDDCECNSSRNCTGMCPEMAVSIGDPGWAITATPKSKTVVRNIRLTDGLLGAGVDRSAWRPVICK